MLTSADRQEGNVDNLQQVWGDKDIKATDKSLFDSAVLSH